jgi:hypothetical protein
MDTYLLSLELNAAAMKQCINARQVFHAYELGLKHEWKSVAALQDALRKQEHLNVQFRVGSVDLDTFEWLQQEEAASSIVIGEHALYAYEANAGIRLEHVWERSSIETVQDYPLLPYQAIVVAIDGRMARMRVMQPQDYVNAGYPLADMVNRMIVDHRLSDIYWPAGDEYI